jgi:hypothetical protein
MEAMLGISLYSYLYPKVAKMLCLSYYPLCFLFNKIGEEGRTSSVWKRGGERERKIGEGGGRGTGGKVAQTMYVHMNKYKNNKEILPGFKF